MPRKNTIADLIQAIRRRDLSAVKKIAKSLAPLGRDEDDGDLPLVEAVSRGTHFVQALLENGADLEGADYRGYTPLVEAIVSSEPEVVDYLLEIGANPRVAGNRSLTPLSAAVSSRETRRLEVASRLLRMGIDPNHELISKSGLPVATPLFAAAEAGNPEAVKLLIQHGADVNKRLAFGSPLGIAVKNGNADVVMLLLEAGADPKQRMPAELSDIGGKSPVEIAVQYKHRRIAELLDPSRVSRNENERLTVPAALTRLETALKAALPAVFRSLREGASKSDLQQFQKRFEIKLPDDALKYFARHDGQSSRSRAFIPSPFNDSPPFRLLSLSNVAREWDTWRKLEAGGEFKALRALPDKGVRKTWYSKLWIPLTSDGLGNCHCLDLDPTKQGAVGQIVMLWHDDEARPIVAKSLTQWLVEIAESVGR